MSRFWGKKSSTVIIDNDVLDSPSAGSALTVDQLRPIYKTDSETGRTQIVQEFPAAAQAHGFTHIVDNYAGYATQRLIDNGVLYQLEGSSNRVLGRFEWIIQDGQVTHRMFIKKWNDEWGANKAMIKIDNIKQLGLTITWRLLYKGICEKQLEAEDVIAYAIEKLEQGDDRIQVCELAGAYVDEQENICNLLWELVEQENVPDDFNDRKIRAAIVSNVLKKKKSNYINGLMELTDLWIDLGYPNDSPHIIQGKDNDIAPDEYYTADNYNLLYEKNVEWLRKELKYQKKISKIFEQQIESAYN